MKQSWENFSKLKLVAISLDGLMRKLDPSYAYWEDLNVWLAGSDSSYQSPQR
jgi:hypothetical protein